MQPYVRTGLSHGQVEQGGKVAKAAAVDAVARTPLGAGSAVRAAILDGSGSPGAGPPGAGQVWPLLSLHYLAPLQNSSQLREHGCSLSLWFLYLPSLNYFRPFEKFRHLREQMLSVITCSVTSKPVTPN